MRFPIPSYSHSGEDRLVLKLFQWQQGGIYVDVGCNHPTEFSNTYLLYQFGWSGLVIDADDAFLPEFGRVRPRDAVIHCGIARESGAAELKLFMDRSLNTFSAETAAAVLARDPDALVGTRTVQLSPLAEILAIEEMGEFDFLNVDVEGYDLQVLESSDWGRWRPAIVAVEDHGISLTAPQNSETYRFMAAQDYALHSKCNYTSVYVRGDYHVKG
jgi:FkbM family methyltransferase